jgi:small subunit ribosomal protein S6
VRQYEVIYILDPNLEEEGQTAQIERFRGIVEAQGGSVQHVERWERRRLAYEVKGRREGYYVVMNFTSEPAAEKELSRVMGITDAVVRHMIVRVDPKIVERQIAESKAQAEARARAEAEARAAAEAAAAAAPPPAPEPAAVEAPAPAPAVDTAPDAAPAADAVPAEAGAEEAAGADPGEATEGDTATGTVE